MFSTKLFMCLLVIYSCDAAFRTCENCVLLRNCLAAVQIVKNIDESKKSLIKNSLCGIDRINGKRLPKICCSDFDTEIRRGDLEIVDDIEKHKNIVLLPENCGEITEYRILGGTIAELSEFPWMALIAYSIKTRGEGTLQFQCGGSIINSKYILTAAHCVKNQNIAGVRVGEHNLSTRVDCQGEAPYIDCNTSVQDIRVEKTIVHSDYLKHPYIQNDIALIRLKEPVDFTFYNAAPICLPVFKSLRNISLLERFGTIAGWGLTEDHKESNVLLKVDIPILNNTMCSQLYNKKNDPEKVNLMDKKLCAGERGKDSCKGDSGGPLMLPEQYNGEFRMYQYGIVSFGPRNCGTSIPGVYTDVTKYIKWILDNIEE